jgi:hypothetical protein
MTIINEARGNVNSSPQSFALHALEYHDLGLSIFPSCTKGKKNPLVNWGRYQNNIQEQYVFDWWLRKFPNANISLITGQINNITVIDSDDPDLSIDDLQNEFGKTPFIASTPRGGFHLYYSFNDELSKIGYQGRKIDVKARGGYIVAPHSFNQERKGYYELIKGDLRDLLNLPPLKANLSIIMLKNKILDVKKDNENNSDFLIEEGQRNNYLFNKLKEVVRSYKNYNELENKAFEINNFCFIRPLNNSEVITTAKSVWKLKEEGRIFNVGQKFVALSFDERILSLMQGNKVAFALFFFLKANHTNIRIVFKIDQISVSKILKCSRETLRKAIRFLIENNFLKEKTKNKGKKRLVGNKIKTTANEYCFVDA